MRVDCSDMMKLVTVCCFYVEQIPSGQQMLHLQPFPTIWRAGTRKITGKCRCNTVAHESKQSATG